MGKFITIIFILLSYSGLSQAKDSTLAVYFISAKKGKTIIKKEGSPVKVTTAENESFQTEELIILSDSTIQLDSDTVLLAEVTTVSKLKKKRAILGGALTVSGAIAALAGVGIISWTNEQVNQDLVLLFLYLPFYALAAATLAGGALIAGVGTIMMLSSIPRTFEVTKKAIVKPYEENYY